MQVAAGVEAQKQGPTAMAGPWMAVQYPQAAFVMRNRMMPLPQLMMAARPFLPYLPPPPIPPLPQQQAAGDENRTIWVGDLDYWMDENYLHSCFAPTGEVVSIKVIRNKQTGQSECYGFVEFFSHTVAEKVLQSFNGIPMPNTDQVFRINWASFSMGERRVDAAPDHSVFVGDLASDVTDSMLHDTFASRYSSVKGAKVVIDSSTGRSKGYGFVRFGDDNQKLQAMTEMNGVYCSTRPMRIGAATPRKSSGGFGSSGMSSQGFTSDGDSCNTTIFVGGLDPNVSEDDLRQTFSLYGEIGSVKIPVGKQCGFVQFVHRNNAEDALHNLQGKVLGKQTVRLSWGRSPAGKQLRADTSNNWNTGVYYGGQVYSGYGYATPFHDPGFYAAGYAPYPIYGSQQQVR